MLTKIEVAPKTFTRFKSDEPIPAGLYYCTRQRLNLNPQLKKAVAAVAATGRPVRRKQALQISGRARQQ